MGQKVIHGGGNAFLVIIGRQRHCYFVIRYGPSSAPAE